MRSCAVNKLNFFKFPLFFCEYFSTRKLISSNFDLQVIIHYFISQRTPVLDSIVQPFSIWAALWKIIYSSTLNESDYFACKARLLYYACAQLTPIWANRRRHFPLASGLQHFVSTLTFFQSIYYQEIVPAQATHFNMPELIFVNDRNCSARRVT
jgi:hypothetical protein